MFGFGKKKLQLMQTSRLIATTLINIEKNDYSSITEVTSTFDEIEIEYINTELFTLRIIAMQFAFVYISYKNKYRISSNDLGHHVAYGARLAFEDLGYNEKHIEFMAEKNIEDIAYITEDLIKINSFERNLLISTIALSFADRFLSSLEISNELKRTTFFICATSVVAMVFDVVEDFVKQIKIVEFR